ncbi:MAG: pseudouridine synthase [Phycisphaerales bacterium]
MPARPDANPDLTDASRGERLQRVLADAGVASRRKCEELIEDGHVTVNGERVTALPAWADPETDRIEVDGRPIPRAKPKHLYIMLNKPPRTLTAAADEPGSNRRTVVELVDHPLATRLFPVGRLDYDTTGLLILTNDGELANRLTHPRFGVPKTYRAKVAGVLDEPALRELERGIYLAERKSGATVGAKRTSHVELAVHRHERDATILDITLREGRNRQVRRMLAAVDLPVKKLERIAIGPVELKGVARGDWRELGAGEVRALRRAAADARTDGSATGGGKKAGQRGGKKPSPKKAGPKKPGQSRRSGSKQGPKRPKNTPEAPPESAKVKRRSVKNAINRAAQDGRD